MFRKGITEIPSKESLLQRERWEISEILLVAIGALGQQGSARDPSTSAARMLLLVMLLLAALAYTAYSASVISLVSLLPSAEKEESALTKNVPADRKISIHDTNFFKHSFKVSIKLFTIVGRRSLPKSFSLLCKTNTFHLKFCERFILRHLLYSCSLHFRMSITMKSTRDSKMRSVEKHYSSAIKTFH